MTEQAFDFGGYHLCRPGIYYDPGEPPCVRCAAVHDRLCERGLFEKVAADSNLGTALHYHPQSWSLFDLEDYAFGICNEKDEPDFTWVLKADGKWLAVRGWHDYTGWDCQSGLKSEVYDSREAAERTLVDWERDELERQRRNQAPEKKTAPR